MPDFPISQHYNQISITTFSPESLGIELRSMTPTYSSTIAVWPSASTALYMPVEIYQPVTIAKISVICGASSFGAVDVGIYEGTSACLLVSSGSTAQAASATLQTFDITDTLLLPGLYYLAMVANVASANAYAALTISGCGNDLRALGVYQQATAFPLPASATFAANAQAFIPFISMTAKTTI